MMFRGPEHRQRRKGLWIGVLAALFVLLALAGLMLTIHLLNVRHEYRSAVEAASTAQSPEYAIGVLEEVLQRYPRSGHSVMARALLEVIVANQEKSVENLARAMTEAKTDADAGRFNEACDHLQAAISANLYASNVEEARRLLVGMEAKKRQAVMAQLNESMPKADLIAPVPLAPRVETPPQPGLELSTTVARQAGSAQPDAPPPLGPEPRSDKPTAAGTATAPTKSTVVAGSGGVRLPAGQPDRSFAPYMPSIVSTTSRLPSYQAPAPTATIAPARTVVGSFSTKRQALQQKAMLLKQRGPTAAADVTYETNYNYKSKNWELVAVSTGVK